MIDLERVSRVHRLGSREIHVLREVSFRIEPGESVAITGPSGSGKTTLLQILGGLDVPSAGSVRFLGRDLTAISDRERSLVRRRQIGFVFQDCNLVESLNAAENVALPLMLDGTSRRKAIARAIEELERLGMGHRASHYSSELSGGEAQRVAIARALSTQPSLVLCDEPTGSLDSANGREVRRILQSIPERGGRSVVVVTHDLEAANDADRIIHIKDGRVADAQPQRGAHGCALSHA
jgi:putative ABC transport system ATP-binding protein